MLGLRRSYHGLLLRPCLPSHWTEASLTRHHRGTCYQVRCARDGPGGAVLSAEVDGRDHDPDSPLPILPGERLRIDVRVG